jgi:hypothetical protein
MTFRINVGKSLATDTFANIKLHPNDSLLKAQRYPTIKQRAPAVK